MTVEYHLNYRSGRAGSILIFAIVVAGVIAISDMVGAIAAELAIRLGASPATAGQLHVGASLGALLVLLIALIAVSRGGELRFGREQGETETEPERPAGGMTS